MAAEVLAAEGHRVDVYDQRRSPARKFVLAGRGGLNLTHSEPIDDLLSRYGPERKNLETAIRGFGPEELREWCDVLGHETFVGSSGRVFPKEFRAVPLLRSWLRRLGELGVELHLGTTWTGWQDEQHLHFTRDGDRLVVSFDIALLALGGASWPRVSSDGSWQDILRRKSIAVETFRSANCGVDVSWSEVMIDRFAGEPVKNAAVAVSDIETGEVHSVRGDPVISQSGLEGGPIYAQGRRIRAHLGRGDTTTIAIDLFPDLTAASLYDRLATRKSGESAAKWLRRSGVAPVGASLLREATQNNLPSDPREMAALAKAVPVTVTALGSIDRAISTAGGVAWHEVDESFQLRKAPNVYVAGEMLDWEAPTGGYLLQGCFSTGHHAATAMIT